MTATAQPTTKVAPRNMEEAYVMLYGKIGEIRQPDYIMWIETPITDNSKQTTN